MDYWTQELSRSERQEKKSVARVKKKYRALIRKHGLAHISTCSGPRGHFANSITFGRRQIGNIITRHRTDGPATIVFDNPRGTVEGHLYYQNNRLHREDGPAVVEVKRGKEIIGEYHPLYRPNNSTRYMLQGVEVQPYVVMEPHKITVAKIKEVPNIEARRIMIERLGWIKYLEETKAKTIDSRVDDISGTKEVLFKLCLGVTKFIVGPKKWQQRTMSVVLVCSCPSTGRVYSVEVADNIKTCVDAQKWLLGPTNQNVKIIGAS